MAKPKTDAAQAKFDAAENKFLYGKGSFEDAFQASRELARAEREEGTEKKYGPYPKA